MPALGEEFRSAREARGLTLSDVAEQIHIRSVYLNAIENEEWTSIGAPVYVRGFIRTYARFLGLDAESAVERFNQSAPAARPVSHTISQVGTPDRDRPSLWAIVATVVAALLVAFVGYEWWSYSQASSDGGGRTAATASPRPGGAQPVGAGVGSGVPAAADGSAAPSARPSGAPAGTLHHQLAVRLVQRSWIRVAMDGVTKVEGIFPAGTARTFSGSVADVRAGNAAGVTISVNGATPVSMGKEGDVVEQRFTL